MLVSKIHPQCYDFTQDTHNGPSNECQKPVNQITRNSKLKCYSGPLLRALFNDGSDKLVLISQRLAPLSIQQICGLSQSSVAHQNSRRKYKRGSRCYPRLCTWRATCSWPLTELHQPCRPGSRRSFDSSYRWGYYTGFACDLASQWRVPQQVYPLLFEICPLTMRTHGILLVKDALSLTNFCSTDGGLLRPGIDFS